MIIDDNKNYKNNHDDHNKQTSKTNKQIKTSSGDNKLHDYYIIFCNSCYFVQKSKEDQSSF